VPKMRASAAITPASSKFIPLSLLDYLVGLICGSVEPSTRRDFTCQYRLSS
jgi:hypothetical protein